MKYPCSLIQDLLPLYHDSVCSEESRKIIESHLSECSLCKDSYNSICQSDEIFPAVQNAGLEMRKAESFRAVKKRIRKKQIAAVIIAAAIFVIISISAVFFLKNSLQVIPYEDSISVSMIDDSLTGRLQGNQASYLQIKQVETVTKGKTNICLFFCLSGTKWDDFVTNKDVFSEYVLCSAEKGAAQIDKVFYYTGDYSEIENMEDDDIEKVIKSSVLLWEK